MPSNKNNIQIDLGRDSLYTEISLKTLKDRYLKEGETSPQHALARASAAFADDDAHAQRLYDAVSKHWFMFSTPILANGGTKNGLGISCFLQNVEDSIQGITKHYTESTFLTVNGGGLGGYWGGLRTSGKKSKSNGMIPFLKVMDSLMLAGNQTETRRGAYAAYLDISHPEIEEFIDIRDNGDHNRRCLGIGFHHAVVIPDSFMNAVEKNLDWNLIDPHTKEVTNVLKARELWAKIIKTRQKLGEPYLMFVDTAHTYLPDNLRKKGLKIVQSNLCNEIFLPSGIDYNGKNRTAICCLSSLNATTYSEWKDHVDQLVEDIQRFLDNVVQHFIDNAPPEAAQAVYAASMTRDIGMGMMGFHRLLQSRMIAFESSEASELNNELFYTVWRAAEKAGEKLGAEKGYYPDAYDFNGKLIHKTRNAHKTAIAPNASSAIICGGTSASCELDSANAIKKTTASGSFLTVNPVLKKLLQSKNEDTEEVWNSIIAHDGSVQQLSCLTDHEKLVFKTSFEVDQQWVIEHAALRQSYIDMGQSVNLFFDDNTPLKEINKVHMSAHKKGLKGLYYLHGRAQKSNERISAVKSRETVNPDMVTCAMCEG